MVRVRIRATADLDGCVEALRAVYRASGYPTNWPAGPAQRLTPSGTLLAWIATVGDVPVAGHVLLRQLSAATPAGRGEAEISRLYVIPAAHRQGVARALIEHAIERADDRRLDLRLEVAGHLRGAMALYQQSGFQLTGTGLASWTRADGQPVTLHHYARRRHEPAPGPSGYGSPVNLSKEEICPESSSA
jgi:ribosomal protein S18 acetylase RimI-like enzyme